MSTSSVLLRTGLPAKHTKADKELIKVESSHDSGAEINDSCNSMDLNACMTSNAGGSRDISQVLSKHKGSNNSKAPADIKRSRFKTPSAPPPP